MNDPEALESRSTVNDIIETIWQTPERYSIVITVLVIYLSYQGVRRLWKRDPSPQPPTVNPAPPNQPWHVFVGLATSMLTAARHGTGIGSSSPASGKTTLGLRSIASGSKFWSSTRKPSNHPPGLGNYDNSCYQNSVLQSLASLASLKTFLEKESDKSSDGGNPPKTISALHALLDALQDAENNGRRIWTPKALKSMSSWQQQDAHEYLQRIVDELEKDSKRLAAADVESKGLSDISRIDEKEVECGGEPPVDEDSPATNKDDDPTTSKAGRINAHRMPLEGLLGQRVACVQCGFSEGLSLLPFNCMTVSVGKNRSYDIQECLDDYISIDTIPGVQCSCCTLRKAESKIKALLERKDIPTDQDGHEDSPFDAQLKKRLSAIQKSLAENDFTDDTLTKTCSIPKKTWVTSTKTKQAVVARAPQALVIHVNRSVFDERTGALRKNHARITYPKHVDLGPWSLQDDSVSTEKSQSLEATKIPLALGSRQELGNGQGPHYELRAVTIHQGQHEDGHYVCYRQHAVAVADEPPTPDGEQVEEVKARVPASLWWEISDDDVSSVTEEMAMRQHEAFLLFYEQVSHSEEKDAPTADSPGKEKPEIRNAVDSDNEWSDCGRSSTSLEASETSAADTKPGTTAAPGHAPEVDK